MHALTSAPPSTIDMVAAAGSVAAVMTASAIDAQAGAVSVLIVAAIAAVVDLRERRIPDGLVVIACVPAVVVAVLGSASLGSIALGALAMAAPLFVLHVASPTAMGFGDVKLAVPLGAALGAVAPVLALVALCVASGVSSAVGLAQRRTAVPFGPGLVTGAGAALAISFLTDWFSA